MIRLCAACVRDRLDRGEFRYVQAIVAGPRPVCDNCKRPFPPAREVVRAWIRSEMH